MSNIEYLKINFAQFIWFYSTIWVNNLPQSRNFHNSQKLQIVLKDKTIALGVIYKKTVYLKTLSEWEGGGHKTYCQK